MPGDSTLLYAALNTPFFGISQQQLFDFVRINKRISIYADASSEAKEVSEALGRIKTMNNWQKDYSPATAFRKILKEIHFYSWLKSRPEGKFKAGLIRDVEKMFQNNNFHDGVTNFGHWISSWPSENRPGEKGKVSLMSVFRAKGLEAPVVIFAGIESARSYPPSICIDREGHRGKGVLIVNKTAGEFYKPDVAKSARYDELADQEKNEFRLEALRKDYVAVTRARDYLILAGMVGKNGNSKTVLRKELQSFTEGLPQINIPDEGVKIYAEEKLDKQLSSDYYKFQQKLADWYKMAGEKSFEEFSITKFAEKKDKSLFSKQSDGGLAYGTALHELLEKAMIQGLKDSSVLKSSLKKMVDYRIEIEPELKPNAETLFSELLTAIKHPVWQEAQQCKYCYSEVPITSLEHDLQALPIKLETGKALRLNGTIDLIFKGKSGWKIVDYKTDRVDNDIHLEKLAEWHKPQIDLYACLWEKISGAKVAEKSLLFVNCNKIVSW